MKYTKSYSFASYKGGSGRSFTLISVADALVLQGCNTLLVDLDIEAPGITILSSTNRVNELFQPQNIFPLNSGKDPDSPLLKKEPEPPSIHIPGIVDIFKERAETIDKILSTIPANTKETEIPFGVLGNLREIASAFPIYECRTKQQHPLEGRLFFMPVGGKFHHHPIESQNLTDWVFKPYDQINIRHINDLFYHGKLPLFHYLLESAKERIKNKAGISLDYTLVDERPGLTGRTLVDIQWTDGTVFVMGTSRGNMAGTLREAERHLGHIKNLDEKPPIVGLVMNQIPQAGVEGDIKTIDVLPSNADQAGIGQFVTEYTGDSEYAKANGIAIERPEHDLNLYAELLGLNRRPFSAPGKDLIRDQDASNSEQKSANKTIWHRIFSGTDEQKKLGEWIDWISPLPLVADFRLFDEPGNMRRFSHGQPDLPPLYAHLAESIAILAGHLRIRKDNKGKHHDAVATSWLAWRENGKVPNRPDEGEQNWLAHWLWAEIKYQQEADQGEEVLQDILETTDRAIDQQKKHVDQLPGEHRQTRWRGDWRLLMLRGRLSRALQRYQDALDDQKDALNALDNEIESAQQNKPALSDTVFQPSRQDILRLQAGLYEQLDRWTDAWNRWKELLERAGPTTFVHELKGAEHFMQSWIQAESHKARDPLHELAFGLIGTRLNPPYPKIQLILPFARLALRWYRYDTDHAQAHKELDKVLVVLSDWQNKIEQGRLGDIPDHEYAEGLRIMGILLMEEAIGADRYSRTGKVADALKQFESAALRGDAQIIFYLYLAVARILDWRQTTYKEENGNSSSMDNQAEAQVRQRDAFYALEQAVGLYRQARFPDSGEYYFTSERAVLLSTYPEAALKLLLQKDLLSDDACIEGRKFINRWLDQLHDASITPDQKCQEQIKDWINTKLEELKEKPNE